MKKQVVLSGVLAVGLIAGGTAIFAASNSEAATTTGNSEVSSASFNPETMINFGQAKKAALKAAGNKGHIDDIDLERYNNIAFYDVEIEQGDKDVTVHIDAYTGKTLDVFTHDDDRYDDDRYDDDDDRYESEAIASVKLSAADAEKIAIKQLSNSKVVQIELDEDDNRLQYEVEVVNSKYEAEVEIDANTGKVLSIDKDDRDDD
ncbi:PepSY domain-containing protein [Paenibacillus sp. 453mf]|uniref:PepSY domain-containing protein n=1 Tax=Paenibacillus sp. 453mf TaxID=1761874 RepID=UPI0008E774F0|nr:PepSY domain-containing protein [Paenibacillus sp. 453mf]SFS77925.1 Peptidase propeptide and YPEB domain-containing protein [Paenibacillus sp. 453mf]